MLNLNFTPFPILKTDRLLLRQVILSDVSEVFDLRSDPQTMHFVPRPLAKNLDEAAAHILLLTDLINSKQAVNWCVTIKNYPKLMGIMGLFNIDTKNQTAEIGYMIMPKHNNKGYTTEAVKAITNYAFQAINLQSINAKIDGKNIASQIVIQKCGYTNPNNLIEIEQNTNKEVHLMIYKIANDLKNEKL